MPTAPNLVPLTYNSFVQNLANLAVVDVVETAGVFAGTEAYFNLLIPTAINYAELRIQRDMDLLPSLTTRGYTLTSGSAFLTLSANDFVTVQDVNINVNGQQTPLLPVSKEFLQYAYPSTATPGPPGYFAMLGGDLATGGTTSNIIQVGPPPDNMYPVSVNGTIRLPSLALYNTAPQAGSATTFISTYLSDLMIQAAMIMVAEYQRDFGRISDDPQMAMTYETAYQNLLKSAYVEEARKKFSASAWSSMSPPLVATPA